MYKYFKLGTILLVIMGFVLIIKMDKNSIFINMLIKESYDSFNMSKNYNYILGDNKKDQITKKILKDFKGRKVFCESKRINNRDSYVVYGYSKKFNNNIVVDGKSVNFSVVYTYDLEDNITNLYIGSPIVNVDY